ncbi:hypothetical protein J6590_024503 [Homalodisca vitripennis]|nr:hypothetical protein J6590_024503 [Homalodisca vitripennis]
MSPLMNCSKPVLKRHDKFILFLEHITRDVLNVVTRITSKTTRSDSDRGGGGPEVATPSPLCFDVGGHSKYQHYTLESTAAGNRAARQNKGRGQRAAGQAPPPPAPQRQHNSLAIPS